MDDCLRCCERRDEHYSVSWFLESVRNIQFVENPTAGSTPDVLDQRSIHVFSEGS